MNIHTFFICRIRYNCIHSNSATAQRVMVPLLGTFKKAGLRSPRTQLTKVQVEISVWGRCTEAKSSIARATTGFGGSCYPGFLPYSQSYQHHLPRMTSLSPTGGWMISYMTCFARKVLMTSQANTTKRQCCMARFFSFSNNYIRKIPFWYI